MDKVSGPSSTLLEQYKNDYWAAHWGIEITSITAQSTVLELPYREIQLNHAAGVVHGGVLATAMQDAGLLLTCEAYDIDPKQVELLDSQISYISGTRDKDITITAAFSRQARRFAFIHVEIKDHNNRLIANNQILFRIRSDANEHTAEALIYNKPSPLLMDGSNNHPMADTRFSPNLKNRSGLEVTHLTACQAQVKMPLDKMYMDFRGQVANGVILHMADTAGVFGPFAHINKPVNAATVDFKMTFCEATVDEELLATSVCINHNGNVMFNRIEVHGARSERLKAFGTQTFWVDI